jgi:hypothetical protein
LFWNIGIMRHDRHNEGVVVLLRKDKFVLLTSNVHRVEAARLIRWERKVHHPLKFFPMPASQAAAAIHRLNHSDLVKIAVA